MSIKFSEDVVPLTDLKINPGRVVKHATDVHRPILLTKGLAQRTASSIAKLS